MEREIVSNEEKLPKQDGPITIGRGFPHHVLRAQKCIRAEIFFCKHGEIKVRKPPRSKSGATKWVQDSRVC